MNRELIEKLRKINLSLCLSKSDVWSNSFSDIEGINLRLYDSIDASLRILKADPSAKIPGEMILGVQGAGKTHFIASLRRRVSSDVTFIYADMTGIKDFWRTLLHEVLSSLRNKMNGVEQTRGILSSFLDESEADKCLHAPFAEILNYEKKIQSILFRADGDKTMKYRDLLRAFLLFCADDIELKSIGDDWLKGYGIAESLPYDVRFGEKKSDAREVVLGLAWLASFRGPILFAIDQIDALATDKEHATQEAKDAWLAEALRIQRIIIQSLTNGMASLITDAPRSLVLLTCIDFSLASLKEHSLGPALDRFKGTALMLEKLSSVQRAQQLIESRIPADLKEIAPKIFPFSSEFFKKMESQTPRKILQMCAEELQPALEKVNFEVHADHSKIEACFNEGSFEEEATNILDSKDAGEERIGNLLLCASKWFVDENDLHEKITLEDMHTGKDSALHVRAVIRDKSDMTVCLRCLLPSYYGHFRSRLENALVASGIDNAVASRKLIIFSSKDIPQWPSAKETITKFDEAGGIYTVLSQKQLAMLLALEKISSMNGFDAWLQHFKPIKHSGIFDGVIDAEQMSVQPNNFDFHDQDRTSIPKQPEILDIPEERTKGGLFLGNGADKRIFLAKKALCEHLVILASSGSGKTVLLRRIIEQSVLNGIPSIVIDAGNDLARLGTPRIETEDEEYFKRAEVVVWTPGARAGRPITFPPLPDFSDIKDDENALSQAIDLAGETLSKSAASGNSTKSKLKRGLLHSALQHFAKTGYKPFRIPWITKESRLSDFIKFLENLPEEAQIGIAGAKKLAKEMADILKSERQRNPDFQDSPSFDIGALLTANKPEKVRVSVVNLSGLQSIESQCSFINQLAMNLFLHVRKNPAAGGDAQAILAIDEAQEFIPAGSAATACKTNLLRLVAQGRKYGLGLIFATQNPRNLDYKAMGNIGTYLLGRTQAPNTVKQLSELISAWGAGGKRYAVGCLEKGEFYLRSTIGYTDPLKIKVPMCLSMHPTGETLTHEEIIKLARKPL